MSKYHERVPLCVVTPNGWGYYVGDSIKWSVVAPLDKAIEVELQLVRKKGFNVLSRAVRRIYEPLTQVTTDHK